MAAPLPFVGMMDMDPPQFERVGRGLTLDLVGDAYSQKHITWADAVALRDLIRMGDVRLALRRLVAKRGTV